MGFRHRTTHCGGTLYSLVVRLESHYQFLLRHNLLLLQHIYDTIPAANLALHWFLDPFVWSSARIFIPFEGDIAWARSRVAQRASVSRTCKSREFSACWSLRWLHYVGGVCSHRCGVRSPTRNEIEPFIFRSLDRFWNCLSVHRWSGTNR